MKHCFRSVCGCTFLGRPKNYLVQREGVSHTSKIFFPQEFDRQCPSRKPFLPFLWTQSTALFFCSGGWVWVMSLGVFGPRRVHQKLQPNVVASCSCLDNKNFSPGQWVARGEKFHCTWVCFACELFRCERPTAQIDSNCSNIFGRVCIFFWYLFPGVRLLFLGNFDLSHDFFYFFSFKTKRCWFAFLYEFRFLLTLSNE